MENKDGAFAFAGGIGDDGGVDLQPALAQLRQLEFVIEHLLFRLDALDEFGELVKAQRLHDGFAAQLGFQAEEIFEGAVGEINFPAAVEQQQTLQHGVEQHLLLRLGVNGRLLLTALEVFHIRLHLLLLPAEFLPPGEMNADGGGDREDGQERPHAGRMNEKMQNEETFFIG